jgi:hypothetical protein
MPTTGGPDKDLPNSPTRPDETRSDSDSGSDSFPGNIRLTLDGRMTEPRPLVAAQQDTSRAGPPLAGGASRKILSHRHAETEGATSAISAAAESRPMHRVGRPSSSRPPPVPATASESLQSEAQPTYTGELHAKPDARHQSAQVSPPANNPVPWLEIYLLQPPASAGDQRGHRAPRISVSKSSHPAPRVAQSHGIRSPGSMTRSQTSPLSQQNPPAVPVAPQGPVGRTEPPPKPPAVLSPPNRVARAPSHNGRMVPGTNTGARHLPPTPLEMQAQKARLGGEQRECMRTRKICHIAALLIPS